jgi:DNA polymerase (family 10)
MDRHAAAHVLDQIAAHLEVQGEAPGRVRSFRAAARAVEGLPGDLGEALRGGAFEGMRGMGPETLATVRELEREGRATLLERLRHEVPPGLVEMLGIAGLGVARIRTLHRVLGITTLAELEAAALQGRLADLPRFGERTAMNIVRGIALLRRTGAPHLLHHGTRRGEQLRRTLAAFPGVSAVEVAGSVRRRCELVRDVDLAVATGDAAALAAGVARLGGVRDVAGMGDTSFTVHFDDGMPAKVWAAFPARFGHLLVRATGSRAHLDELVRVAADRGLTLDAAGLWRDGEAVPCPDEAMFYAALGLSWIPPELREGRHEIARAAAGALPRLVERADVLGLIHCHTTDSDGATGLADFAAACHAAGFRYLGVTDHSEASTGAGGLSAETIARQHAEIDAWNAAHPEVRVLKGIEADILPDGQLDYTPAFLDRFDFVIASVHTRLDLPERQMTERVLRALDDPHTAILGHPTGRLLLEQEGCALDLDAVIARAAERGVAIEINADPQRLDLDWEHAAAAAAAGVPIPIGADAHSIAGLANVDLGVGIARKAGLSREQVLNTRDVEGFLAHARARR